MKIGHFDAVCAMGKNIEEVFENLLNKISYMNANYAYGDEILYTGRLEDADFEAKTSEMLNRYSRKNEAHLITVNAEAAHGFASMQTAVDLKEALERAEELTANGKIALIFATHKTSKEEIEAEIAEGRYSNGVAKPFDIDADGLNLSDAAAIIELSSDGKYEISRFDESEKDKIEYIHTCANGVRSEDAALCEELAGLFTQSAFVGSPIGAIGDTKSATDALSLAVLCQAVKEEILPASSMLEHAFTNELNFAYANKMKRLKNTLFITTDKEYYRVSKA